MGTSKGEEEIEAIFEINNDWEFQQINLNHTSRKLWEHQAGQLSKNKTKTKNTNQIHLSIL